MHPCWRRLPPEPKSARLGFVAGMIAEDKLHSFERLLFRATRGNMFLKSASVGTVVDPTTTEKVEKAVFVVFFAGERARSKILKVCAAAWSLGLPLIQRYVGINMQGGSAIV